MILKFEKVSPENLAHLHNLLEENNRQKRAQTTILKSSWKNAGYKFEVAIDKLYNRDPIPLDFLLALIEASGGHR